MKRAVVVTSLLLVFALAVPASAATWRGFGTVKSNGNAATFDRPAPHLGGGANNVEDIQVGFYAWTPMTVDWDGDWSCWNDGGDYASRSKNGTVSVPEKSWKWVNLRAGTKRWDFCDFSAFAYGSKYRSLKVRVRVR